MCDYSLEAQQSRPATVGERIVTAGFPGTSTKGFRSVDGSGVAVCMLPGTELAFDKPVTWNGLWAKLLHIFKQNGSQTAIFRKINDGSIAAHHDALELEDGTVVLLTRLQEGQMARVLQLPAVTQTIPARLRHLANDELELLNAS